MEPEQSSMIGEIREAALSEKVPIIRKETAAFLRVMLLMNSPKNILEIGAGVAYSAIFMSEYIPEGSHITTIENYPPRIERAKENIGFAGKSENITLLEGDALEILPRLSPGYDFIFLDASKGQYINMLPELRRVLTPVGVMISDNVLQEGDIVESSFAVTRRNRTIHKRMREFLREIMRGGDFDSCILPLGDGIALSVPKVPVP